MGLCGLLTDAIVLAALRKGAPLISIRGKRGTDVIEFGFDKFAAARHEAS